MTTHDAAMAWMAEQPLSFRVRRLPRHFRSKVAEGFVLYRGRYSGTLLHEKVLNFVESEPASIPLWLIGPLLDIAVRLVIALLERWWKKHNDGVESV
jgi:hypothetical protein